jgi:hypothetical protein
MLSGQAPTGGVGHSDLDGTVSPPGLLELDRAQQLSPLGPGIGNRLRLGTKLGSPVGVPQLGPLFRVETGEATPGVPLAALSLPLLGALELALVARTGFLELSSEAGQLRPAADRALIDSERTGGGPTGRAGGEQAGKRA